MVKYRIFIAHTSQNEDFARMICNSLSNIKEYEPYLAQDYPSFGENFKERIQKAIEDCSFFIVCLSESALTNQWVNQELGYACAVKKRKRALYHIIPISNKNLELRGMITRDSDDILFVDNITNELLLANIHISIRNKIPMGHTYGHLHVNVKCSNPHCRDHLNLPYLYNIPLPEHQHLISTMKIGENSWYTDCPKCYHRNYVNIYSWDKSDGKKILSIE